MLSIPDELLRLLLVVIVLIVVDLFLGIILSIKMGTFKIERLPDFLVKSIFPYIGGLLVLIVASPYSAEMKALFVAAAAATIAMFIKYIKDKVFSIFGKVPLEDK
jgi:hypothetical protein